MIDLPELIAIINALAAMIIAITELLAFIYNRRKRNGDNVK